MTSKKQNEPTKQTGDSRSGRRGDKVSLHPLSPEEALADLLKIPPKPVSEKREKPERQ